MLGEFGEDLVDAALVEFAAALLGPLFGEIVFAPEDGLGGVEQVLPGAVNVDDLDGFRIVLLDKAPDPAGGDVEAATLALARDAPGEG